MTRDTQGPGLSTTYARKPGGLTSPLRHLQLLAWGLALLLSREGAAQEVSVIPSAAVSTTATSNRDFLPRGQENAQLQLTTSGTLGLVMEGERTTLTGEYRLLLQQPLIVYSPIATEEELDASLNLESQHTLRTVGTWQALQDLALDLELRMDAGDRSPQAVSPVNLVQDNQAVADQAGARVIVQRSRFFALGATTGAKLQVADQDTLQLSVGASWRRNFTPELLAGADDQTVTPTEDFRDTNQIRALVGWQHLFTPVLDGTLEMELTQSVNDLAPDTQSAALRGRGRWRLTERLQMDLLLGIIAVAPDVDDPDFQNSPVVLDTATTISNQLGAGLTWQHQGWQISGRYGRDIITAPTVGDSLLVDAVSTELLYFYDRDAALRVTGIGSVARPVFAASSGLTIGTLNAGMGLVFNLVDWLNFDASYAFTIQQGLGGDTGQTGLAGAGTQLQDVLVHTMFFGLSARTSLTRQSQTLPGEGTLP